MFTYLVERETMGVWLLLNCFLPFLFFKEDLRSYELCTFTVFSNPVCDKSFMEKNVQNNETCLSSVFHFLEDCRWFEIVIGLE
jgi:hypothetical protein